MSDLTVKGKITSILEMESGESKAGKKWNKQSIVINTGSEYNPEICISFFGDKSDLLKKVTEGLVVEVGINISSREFNGKYYHNIDGWKITKVGADETAKEVDDLPF